MIKITKQFLRKHDACTDGYKRFFELFPKGTDVLTGVKGLIKDDKLEWANWLICRCFNRKQKIQYAIYAAEQVLYIFEKRHPDNDKSRKAIEAAKQVLKKNSKQNRAAAAAYAGDAAAAYAYAADAAAAAAYAAAAYDSYNAYAAYDAYNAAYADAADAAAAAADAAADAAAAYSAGDAAAAYADAAYAGDAADAADAAREKMKKKILKYGIKLLNAK
jgi:hypothetical protein